MKIGAICSAGGSACLSALDLLLAEGIIEASDVLIIVDRPCDAMEGAAARDIPCRHIEWKDVKQFSSQTCLEFQKNGIDFVVLFFTRLISRDLYAVIPTFNIHPSLLPSFAGFGALKNAYEEKVRFLGATLHVVNEEMDAGPIVAQVVTPIRAHWNEDNFARVSYIQKTYLMLCVVDLMYNGFLELNAEQQTLVWLAAPKCSASANPCLSTPSLIEAFENFQSALNCEVFLS